MFKNDLLRRVEAIFKMPATFDAQSDENEQDKIFIEVQSCRPRVSGKDGGRETAKVVGNLIVTSQDQKFSYGYFTKCIERARPSELTRPFFFYDIDSVVTSEGMVNIHERQTTFVFLYDSQYDPSKGELQSLDTTINFEV